MEKGWFCAARARNKMAGASTLGSEEWRFMHCSAVFTPCTSHTYSNRAWFVVSQNINMSVERKMCGFLLNFLQKLII